MAILVPRSGARHAASRSGPYTARPARPSYAVVIDKSGEVEVYPADAAAETYDDRERSILGDGEVYENGRVALQLDQGPGRRGVPEEHRSTIQKVAEQLGREWLRERKWTWVITTPVGGYGTYKPGGHAAMSVGGPAHVEHVAPLTFDEYINLVPGNLPPPPVLDFLLRYRVVIEAQLPQITAIVAARAVVLKAEGKNVPARFLPEPELSREDLLQVAADLYRQMLSERYS